MLSRSMGEDPDTPTYLEVISGREDFPCEAFQRATGKDLVLRERVPNQELETISQRRNRPPISQAQNDGSSDNSQEIPVSMDNVPPEGIEDQYITSSYGEDLRRNVHVRRSEN